MIRVLDTNAFSALMRGEEEAVRRLMALPRDRVLVPQPVVAELAYGLERLPSSKRKRALSARFDLLAGEFLRATWDDAVSHAFGRVKAQLERKGTPIEDFDAAIAAHALALDGILVTSNLRHMRRIAGLRTEDWGES